MLEDHVVPFMNKWGAFGTYGEQGMETLHATMNSIKTSFISMPNKTDRLTSVMKEHYMRVNPKGVKIAKSFEPRTRKKILKNL